MVGVGEEHEGASPHAILADRNAAKRELLGRGGEGVDEPPRFIDGRDLGSRKHVPAPTRHSPKPHPAGSKRWVRIVGPETEPVPRPAT